MAQGGGTVGRTVRRSRRREGHALPSSTTMDPGTGISLSPGSWRRSRHRSSAPARNSNPGASYAAALSHLTGLPGVTMLSESERAKHYQLQLVQRDAVACAVAVIAAWWKKLRRPSGDLKDLDKLGIDLAHSPDDLWPAAGWKKLRHPLEDLKDPAKIDIATIDLAPPPVDSVVKVVREPMEALNQLDGAAGDLRDNVVYWKTKRKINDDLRATLSCPFPPLFPAMLARATLPLRALPF